MIEYIDGKVTDLSPTDLILENGGIGYHILISLQTYEAFQGKSEVRAYIHHHLREDEELYFGFASRDERELFRLLISVSGVGAASARMMLSTLTAEEIRQCILSEDIQKIKSVKGIGLKTAQRVILELKDKIVKGGGADTSLFPGGVGVNAALLDEASTALVMLGFSKAQIGKVLPSLCREMQGAKVEDLIKAALQKL